MDITNEAIARAAYGSCPKCNRINNPFSDECFYCFRMENNIKNCQLCDRELIGGAVGNKAKGIFCCSLTCFELLNK